MKMVKLEAREIEDYRRKLFDRRLIVLKLKVIVTARKDVVYLMKYFILYSLIPFHDTISREVIPDRLERYNLRNY